jgi:phosphatidylserine/phosphatidylglycerophosphate/cardiolipin synthase-like enzyme
VYVHAKVCVIDDRWTCVGSDNLNLRSWTHDSELSCAVMDADGGTGFGYALRRRLAREHLGLLDGAGDEELRDPVAMFDAYRRTAAALDAWHADPSGTRPRGRLRPYRPPRLSRVQRAVAGAMYRYLCDPDGRPRSLRRRHAF